MNDDELRDELERRSMAASLRADELLPGVRRAIGGRAARPARFAGWAPLAGLAGAAAIVLALVIAFPGGAPQGALGPARSATFIPTPGFVTRSLVPTQTGRTVAPTPIGFVPGSVYCAASPKESDPGIWILDDTGLVDTCTGQTDRGALPGGVTVESSNDLELSVSWPVVLENCTPAASALELSQIGTAAYLLSIHMIRQSGPSEPNEPICDAATGMQSARLTLLRTIDPKFVSATQIIASAGTSRSNNFEVGGG